MNIRISWEPVRQPMVAFNSENGQVFSMPFGELVLPSAFSYGETTRIEPVGGGYLATLYALKKDDAPLYCTPCLGVFCAHHSQRKEVWDEAGPDFWHGTCPYGHGKCIDH